jgi:hypothetical protein
MRVRQPRYSKEEFARGGDEIYESNVRSHKPLSPVKQMIWVQLPNLHRIVQL